MHTPGMVRQDEG